jgi:hypothetical protein
VDREIALAVNRLTRKGRRMTRECVRLAVIEENLVATVSVVGNAIRIHRIRAEVMTEDPMTAERTTGIRINAVPGGSRVSGRQRCD